MADNKPASKNAGSDNPEGKHGQPARLVCAEFEALLVDALDGTLSPRDAAAFEGHRATCAPCAQLFEEAKRGSEWLHLLEGEPEVPADLVARILAQTSQAQISPGSTSQGFDGVSAQLAIDGMPLAIAQPGWLPGLERHAIQSRWLMTAAMAFFSIAFTLNLTGVKLGGLRLSDLKPSSLASNLTRQFYVADAHVMRYYDNLRFVYELESRVREMKRDVVPAANPPSGDAQPKKKPSDGSAQKGVPGGLAPVAPAVSEQNGEPVMASFRLPSHTASCRIQQVRVNQPALLIFAPLIALERIDAKELCDNNQCDTQIDRAGRSLA